MRILMQVKIAKWRNIFVFVSLYIHGISVVSFSKHFFFYKRKKCVNDNRLHNISHFFSNFKENNVRTLVNFCSESYKY